MGVAEDLADELATATLAAMEELDNDRFFMDVARVVGATSPTLQEAFMTSVRIRMAALRGKRFLEDTLKAKRAGGEAPAAPRDTSAH